MEEEIIHIALSLYDKSGDYSRHVGVTLVSIFENTSSKIQVHLLHDDTLSKENKEKFEELVRNYKQHIKFYYVDIPTSINQYEAIEHLSKGTLFRCYICEILSDLNKVIYLDSDVIVALDIKNLWLEQLNKSCLCAVIDGESYRMGMRLNNFYKKLPIKSNQYFNAGVLVMNLEKIRNVCCLSQACLEFLDKNFDAPALDQDALNYLFQNDCVFIDAKYNLIANQYYKGRFQEDCSRNKKCIWHFAGFIKPWEICEYPVSSLYWEYLHKTPWGEKTEDIIRYMSKMNNHNFPLENVLMSQRIGNRKLFIKNFIKRLLKEIKLKMRRI